jgi:MFS family permease
LRSNAEFRRLWLGNLVSFAGDWFNIIALYTAVQGLSSSAQAIAAVMVAKMLPPFLVTPLVGPIIDRFDRRRILIFTDLARAVCATGLAASYLSDSIAGLYICTAILMALGGLALPARNAVLPMLVPARHLVVANAIGSGTWSAMLALGAALGGVATETLGVAPAFLLDALTFLLAAVWLLGLPRLRPSATSHEGAGGFRDGLRYLANQPYVLALTCIKPVLGVLGGAVVLIPLFGNGAFQGQSGPFYVGLLFAARGFGALLGSLGVRFMGANEPRAMRRAIAAGFAIIGVSYLSLGWIDAFWATAVCFFTAMAGNNTIWVFSGTLLQLETDKRYHGRVFALEFGATTLVMAGSSWGVGAAVDSGIDMLTVAAFIGAAGIAAASVGLIVQLIFEATLQRATAPPFLGRAPSGELQELAPSQPRREQVQDQSS